MNNIIDFTAKMLGIQGLKVIHTYVNNGIFTVCAMPSTISGICPKCGSTTEIIHDVRVQNYMHLPIWGTKTELVLPIFRLECKCDPDHPFDLRYSFIREYQRQTVPYEIYIYNKLFLMQNRLSTGFIYRSCFIIRWTMHVNTFKTRAERKKIINKSYSVSVGITEEL